MLDGLSEKELRKVQQQWKKINGEMVYVPQTGDILEAKDKLEAILTGKGKVRYGFARDTLMALEYAKTHVHKVTHNTMLEDIKQGIPISFVKYVKE